MCDDVEKRVAFLKLVKKNLCSLFYDHVVYY